MAGGGNVKFMKIRLLSFIVQGSYIHTALQREPSSPQKSRVPALCWSVLTALSLCSVDLQAQSAQANLAKVPTSASGYQQLQGHIPATVSRMSSIGRLPGSQRLNLAISLPLRNQEALSNLIQQLYDPASPLYRHYLTAQQFADGFGPSKQDYEALVNFATIHGLNVTKTFPNRVLVDVNASVEDIEKAFHVSFQLYHHPKEPRDFYAPDREPSLDLSVPVLHISGLDTFSLPHPASIHPKKLDASTPARPNAGTGPQGTFIGKDFRNAYAAGTSLKGSGQVVGLIEFDSYFPGDINLYAQRAGFSAVPLENVYVGGFNGVPGSANVEVALDIEVAMAIAPQLSKIIVYQASNPTPWVDMLNRMAQDTEVKQFSSSWGGGNSNPDPAAALIFQQMAVQGQSFFQASGDSDSYTGDIPFPSDSPYVTVVGGTTLTTDKLGAYGSEKVWNWGGGVGSSGGISTFFQIPTWQQGLDMTNNHGSSVYRNIPDVALTADNVFIVADNGANETVGGTSAAAPLWAGFAALVNEQVAAGCGSSLGFLNPAIYGIGKAASYTNLMNDIVKGDNYWAGSPGSFSAVPGFDLCTGWGSPTGSLIDALAGAGIGILSLKIDPPPGSSLLSTDAQPITVVVTGVTNASVFASIPGVTNLTFTNSGGYNYSALLQVPPAPATFAMTVGANAPGRVGVTNTGFYNAVPAPSNDNFVNAIKVPAGGAAYVANNRYATIEAGEPLTNANPNVSASLWWAWTPTTSTSVLLDTSGSRVNNVLAVYTGLSLGSLQSIASASSDVGQLNPSQVTFNAQAGQTYNIALASVDPNSVGSLKLAVVPQGQRDTSPPVLTVTSPQSGLSVSNGLITVTGTAADNAPKDSGVNKVVVTVNGCAGSPASGTTNWSGEAVLQPGLNIVQATAYDEQGNASAPVTLDLVYFAISPGNDFFADAPPLTGAAGTNKVDTTTATKETGEPNHAGNAGGKSVWWTFTAPTDGVLTLSTEGSSFDTLLAVYTGPRVSQLTPIASSDDAFPGAPGGFSLLNQAVHSNITYAIAVDGYNGAAGTNFLAYSFTSAKLVHLETAVTGSGSVQVATVNQLGGHSVQPTSAVDVALNTTVVLTPVAAANYQFDTWSGGVVSISSPLILVLNSDLQVTAHFLATVFSDDFETGTLAHLPWATSGNKPWSIESTNIAAGRYAVRSGIVGNNQTSSLTLTTNFVDGFGSFDYRVSSEKNFDFLKFAVDGTLVQHWSGEAGWTTFTFPISTGTHTLQWTYAKDPSGSDGLDAAFIDNVSLPLSVPKNSTTPAQLQFVMGTDGALFINVFGQTNQQYILQTSTDLKSWQNLSSGFADYGYLRIDTGALTNRAQFYRAVSP